MTTRPRGDQQDALFPSTDASESADLAPLATDPHAPLAARLRPRSLEEIVGQEHLLGPDRVLRQAIQADRIPSMVLWGPPGSGKTTLAVALAASTRSHFVALSGVMAGVADLRKAVDQARHHLRSMGQRTILFVDEIHRWNRAQQDAMLPHVESGILTLVGATTENPSFALASALVSRVRVYLLRPLSGQNLEDLVHRALADRERGLGIMGLGIEPGALAYLVGRADGDARVALNTLELAAQGAQSVARETITRDLVEDALQRRAPAYDQAGDQHYDTISAFIKSVRGSDPDAAIYWLARMLEAGEDALFVARRLVILAGEDIGLADPQALLIAVAAQQAAHSIGLPEAVYPLAEATLYLATAPKSNSVGQAYSRAKQLLEERGTEPVPLHLRNAPTGLMQELGYGAAYVYPHSLNEDDPHRWAQVHLPLPLADEQLYRPADTGFEGATIQPRLDHIRSLQRAGRVLKSRHENAEPPVLDRGPVDAGSTD
jgi:putative ATPase